MDKQKDITKLIVTFRNFAHELKKQIDVQCVCRTYNFLNVKLGCAWSNP